MISPRSYPKIEAVAVLWMLLVQSSSVSSYPIHCDALHPSGVVCIVHHHSITSHLPHWSRVTRCRCRATTRSPAATKPAAASSHLTFLPPATAKPAAASSHLTFPPSQLPNQQ